MHFQGHIQNISGKIQENIMAHLSTLPMDPHLQAAHAVGDFGREWAERAEVKKSHGKSLFIQFTEMATWLYLS